MYQTILALHIIAMVAWMAGMLYLPRLFVYHTGAAKGGELDETLKLMERRLLRFIINPAMIASWVLGFTLLYLSNFEPMTHGYMHVKLLCVLLMSGVHGFFAGAVRKFSNGQNTRSQKFWRILNEVPTVLMIIIVVMIVVKPF